MPITLPFAQAIEDRRMNIASRALDKAEAGKAERAAVAAALGRDSYRPRLWFPNDDVRQIAKERAKAEQKSVKRATGVREYTFHETEEARRASIQASNRKASQKRRDKRKAAI